MEINNKVKETLQDYNINEEEGLLYLMALYFGLTVNLFSKELKQKVHVTNLVYVGNDRKLYWKYKLFVDIQEKEADFEWVVKEYVPMFKAANPKRGGYNRESRERMKKFFKDNPEVTKEDVMNATELYLKNTFATYIMYPHYFISKGVGSDKTYTLLTWIEKVKENQGEVDSSNRVDISNILQ